MIPIDWDSRTPTAFPDGFTLTLKTGVSMGLQNRLTSLALPISVDELPPRYVALKRPSTMRDPFDRHNRIAVLDEARHIVRDLEGLQAELAKLDRPTYDAVPEMIVYSRQTVRGLLRVVIIWGMVLNGSVSKGGASGIGVSSSACARNSARSCPTCSSWIAGSNRTRRSGSSRRSRSARRNPWRT